MNCFSQKRNTFKAINFKAESTVDSIVYANARANSDYQVMMTSIYYMMAKNPQKVIAYKDSLATIYFLIHEYSKCVNAGNEVLSHEPNNYRVMELIAISERIRGNIRSSLKLYEKLYDKTASLIHAYYIAEMQFYLHV